eukprot:SAG11_NODE_23268_length_391_cov_20.746575_1_plen_61_part_10
MYPLQKLRKYVPLVNPYGKVLLGTIYHRLLKPYGKMLLGTIYNRLFWYWTPSSAQRFVLKN